MTWSEFFNLNLNILRKWAGRGEKRLVGERRQKNGQMYLKKMLTSICTSKARGESPLFFLSVVEKYYNIFTGSHGEFKNIIIFLNMYGGRWRIKKFEKFSKYA